MLLVQPDRNAESTGGKSDKEGKIHRGMKVFEDMNIRTADYTEIRTTNEEGE